MIRTWRGTPCSYPACACVGNACCRAGSTGGVLTALEFVARECVKNAEKHLREVWTLVENDDQAIRYAGAGIHYVADVSGWSYERTHAHLERAVAAGTVLREQSRPRGVIGYWPVGLMAELLAERAAKEPT